MFTSSYCITWTCTISVNMQAPYWTEFGRKWSKWSWTSTCTVNQVLGRWSTITGTLSVQMFTSSYCITWTCTISVNMQAPYWTEFGRKWSKWSWTSTCTVNQVLGRWSTITGTLSVQMFTSSYCITWTCTISVNMQAPYCIGFRRQQIRWNGTWTCTVNQILGRWTTVTETLSWQLFAFSYCITWTCTISVNMSASHCIGFRKKQIRWSQTSTCTVNQILGRWTTTTKTISPQLFPSSYCITWTCTISVNM